MGGGLGGQMLAGAEADLQPQALTIGEQLRGLEPPGLGQVQAQLWQALRQLPLPPGTQTMTLAAAVDQALHEAGWRTAGKCRQPKAARSSSTRSVR
jgi:hypothetical protein